ncbi:hypothetical protein [Nocardioides dongkuii]|uniref:hypothetical protein n=1 Tax=Nocardioides dongkuii TaxID=2760089 RepID=UPI0015F85922|nr:hypothetical protein [Nocardioides dongkuii]
MPVALFAVLAVLVAALLGWAAYAAAHERVRRAHAETRRLEVLVDDLKEIAWSHREIDPELSTIIIDTIRTAEREGRPELP